MVHNHNDRREPSKLRARLHQSRHDTRGIALQTVIIMVVLLAIAGAVVAVLLSRAGEATSELESQDVTATKIDTEGECLRYEMKGGGATATVSWTSPQCTFTEPTADDGSVTKGACLLVGGAFNDNGNSANTCVVG